MDETYRMLGRERQGDLEREAQSRRLAAAARGPKDTVGRGGERARTRRRVLLIPARLAALLR